jgi:hypothetical protein
VTDLERDAIARRLADLPPDMVATPATEGALQAFEAEFGPIPPDHRWFLATCGSGVAGPELIPGLGELTGFCRQFQADRQGGHWPLMDDVFVLGLDGGGNYFGLHRPTGRVVVEDHDFGGLHVVAATYAELFLGRDN